MEITTWLGKAYFLSCYLQSCQDAFVSLVYKIERGLGVRKRLVDETVNRNTTRGVHQPPLGMLLVD